MKDIPKKNCHDPHPTSVFSRATSSYRRAGRQTSVDNSRLYPHPPSILPQADMAVRLGLGGKLVYIKTHSSGLTR